MKGQTVLTSHGISIALTIVLVVVIITSFNSIREEYENFVVKEEMDQTCLIVKTAIHQIFYPTDYYVAGTNSKMHLFLPEKIGELNYRGKFSGNIFLISSMGKNITKNCKMEFIANYSGFTSGGKTKLTWAYDSGQKIRMEKV